MATIAIKEDVPGVSPYLLALRQTLEGAKQAVARFDMEGDGDGIACEPFRR